MKKTMLAAMFYQPLDLRVEEVPVPEVEPGGILLKIGAATTCGTDVKIYNRGYPELPVLPMPFGHECAGIVAAVGQGVTNVQEGERIVAGIASPCGKCYWCNRSQPELCIDRTYAIPGGAIAGGAFAEYLSIPGEIVRNNLHRIPENLSFAEAALIEPLGCALYGIEMLPEIRTGDTVVINGDGPLGLFFLCLAKLRGAFVVICGSTDSRLQKAKRLRADQIINIRKIDDQIQAVYDLIGNPGPDVVIEATGVPAVWELSVNMARRGGAVMLFGGCKGGTKVTFDTQKIHYDCLTIKSPSVYLQTPDLLERSLKLLASGGVPGREFITHSYPLEQVVQALEDHKQKKGLKMEILPPDFWSDD